MSSISRSSVENFFVSPKTNTVTLKGVAVVSTTISVGIVAMIAGGTSLALGNGGAWILGAGGLLFATGTILWMVLAQREPKKRVVLEQTEHSEQDLTSSGFSQFDLERLKTDS